MTATRIIPVIVVVQPRVLLLDVAGPIEALRKANIEQSAVRFDVTFVGPEEQCGSSIGLRIAGLQPLPATVPTGGIVIISGSAEVPLGCEAGAPVDPRPEEAIVAWLKQVIQSGTKLIAICSGSLLAARAGLLDGYDCTTHHGSVAELAKIAPRANVLSNRLFVEDGERLTSAGITAGIDLMLHVIADRLGHACAMAVARYMVVYMRRGGADPQLSPWLEGRNHIHPVIHRIQDAIAIDPSRLWSVAELADVAGASARNLSRLFNAHTGMSVTDYVNRMRITLAGEILKSSKLDLEGVAERSGFASARQLRRAWSRYHDAPPRLFRRMA